MLLGHSVSMRSELVGNHSDACDGTESSSKGHVMGNFRVFSAGFSIVVLGCTGEIGAGEPNAVVGQDTGGVTSGSGGVSHQDGSGGSASATSSTGGSSKGASS